MNANQPTESNVIYQIVANEVATHPHTLQIGVQPNPSLVSTPISEYANQPPHFPTATEIHSEHAMAQQNIEQQQIPLTYSEVAKLNQQSQGKPIIACQSEFPF